MASHLFDICCFNWMMGTPNLYEWKMVGNHQTSINKKNSLAFGYQVYHTVDGSIQSSLITYIPLVTSAFLYPGADLAELFGISEASIHINQAIVKLGRLLGGSSRLRPY